MSFALPSIHSDVRQFIDMEAIASLGSEENRARLPTLAQAKARAVEFMDAEPAIKEMIVMAVDDERWLQLYAIGRDGVDRKIWSFGEV